jgi:hypothetical protein
VCASNTQGIKNSQPTYAAADLKERHELLARPGSATQVASAFVVEISDSVVNGLPGRV